jgi:pimeloyl-ACP methyl ester carboxylesterase
MKSKKWRKNVMMVVGVILSATVLFLGIGTILQKTYFQNKLDKIEPYGIFVEVNDGMMHVYSMGEGEETIVLLPGLGIGLPSADFAPLMRTLANSYKVVVVEYFGVGFSTTTIQSRTTENYVEEVRMALDKAGFQAPFILMPHSLSSIYSEYYASKYPDEVKAIVSLDGTSSAYYEGTPSIVNYVLPLAKFQQATGTMSILANVTTNKDRLMSYGYTQQEIQDMIAFGGFSINENLLEQISKSAEYVKDVIDLPFPDSIPYVKVISKQTYETPNKQWKLTPQEYQHQHLARIGEHAQHEILEGNHFIYLNNSDPIYRIVNEMTHDLNGQT